MRTLFALAFTLLIGGAFLASPDTAYAQASASIAVVDVDSVMRDSSAAKGLRTQMQKELDKFQKWGKGQENKFVKEGESLQKQQTVLAQDVLRKRQQALQKKFDDFQVEARRREQKIREAGANARQELEKMLVAVVSDVAKNKGISMVLPKNVMIYSGSAKDLTKETLAQLNKKLPSVAVKVPK